MVNDFKSMVDLAVDVFSAFFVKKDFHLTNREKEFFIGCVMAYHTSVGLNGSKFINYMIENYNFAQTERPIYNMRDTMKRKKWLIQTKHGYDLPPLFKGDISKFTVNLTVNKL